jgi:hypothetical protein
MHLSRIALTLIALLSPALSDALEDHPPTCIQLCSSDLKTCRKQADIFSKNEKIYSASNSNLQTDSWKRSQHNDAVEKLRTERYQDCETNNISCINQCSLETGKQKNSVVFR